MKPYEALTELDHKRIENFVTNYAVIKPAYIGNEKYLSHWNEAKGNLFKLLGNKLIYELPFEYNKTKTELRNKMIKMKEKISVEDMVNELVEKLSGNAYEISSLFSSYALVANETEEDLVFIADDKKPFKIQKGSKPLKMIGKLLDYCGIAKEYKSLYEKFRIGHSQVLNDKTVKGTLCLSIHPLDFMTMSDNGNDWSSCMSWRRSGCYRQGAVEMMNSSRTLVAYIKSESNFNFCRLRNKDGAEWEWNSKKYRQLFYIDERLILSGKSYPYASSPISVAILDIIRGLAKDNLSWIYEGEGAEKYAYPDYKKTSREKGDLPSAVVRVKTFAMYNDFLNDRDRNYYCFVNKSVAETDSVFDFLVSGAAYCPVCGEKLTESYYDNYRDYLDSEEERDCLASYIGYMNNKYAQPDNLCHDRCNDINRCESCGDLLLGLDDFYELNGSYFDKDCARQRIRIDPLTHEPFLVPYECFASGWDPAVVYLEVSADSFPENKGSFTSVNKKRKYIGLCLTEKALSDFYNKGYFVRNTIKTSYSFLPHRTTLLADKNCGIDWTQFFFENLESPF